MKFLKYLASSILILCVVAFLLLGWSGLFAKPVAQQKMMGPYNFVYEPFVGDYRKTGKIYEKINAGLKNIGVNSQIGLGVYYDDPRSVPRENLRSDDGVVIEDKDLAKVPEIEKLYKYKVIPQKESIVAELPVKNFLTYMVGPMRAYPVLMKYAQDNNLKMEMAFEVYDMPGKKIYYVMNITRHTTD